MVWINANGKPSVLIQRLDRLTVIFIGRTKTESLLGLFHLFQLKCQSHKTHLEQRVTMAIKTTQTDQMFCSTSLLPLLQSSNENDCFVSVVSLIASRKWNALRDYLDSAVGRFVISTLLTEETEKGDNLLHLVCRVHPPADIVSTLIDAFPDVAKKCNSWGSTALHLAAAWGASAQVIDVLINANADACSMRDASGKTPLLLTCQHCCEKATCDSGRGAFVKGPNPAVICSLLKASPDVVAMEDTDDMTALEYAIVCGASEKVVRKLQRATAKCSESRTACNNPSNSSKDSQGIDLHSPSLATRRPRRRSSMTNAA